MVDLATARIPEPQLVEGVANNTLFDLLRLLTKQGAAACSHSTFGRAPE
jgi:hypothetical protein